MIFKTPAIRLSIALALLTVNILLVANQIGLVPDASQAALDMRKGLSESLALQFASAAEKGELNTIRNTLRAVVERNDNIRSAAIRGDDGSLIALVGEHLAYWAPPVDGKSTPTHVHVPVYRNNEKWATVEIRFAPFWQEHSVIGLASSLIELMLFIGFSCFICYFFVLKRTLRELDPTKVIPKRVQKAFDALHEGVLILDKDESIVMANQSFADFFGRSPESMLGLKGSDLGWLNCKTPEQVRQLPWFKVLQTGQERLGASLGLLDRKGRKIKVAVNVTLLTDNTGSSRGTLLTFDDITQLEEKNFELSDMIGKLQLANEEIHAKSQELETLANRDPLTLCLNRRSLAQLFDKLFSIAKEDGSHLCCVMADIDFFKSVNDRFGHAIGDQVIKSVADVLKTCTRENDLVGRYGGEEFCVVFPAMPLDTAVTIAERIRQTVEKKSISGVAITVSLGVAAIESNANTAEELINQADKALYTAKESGRNRVVAWGRDNVRVNDAEFISVGEDSAEQHGQSTSIEEDQAQSQSRVLELEGLLKKRTLEIKHHEMYDQKTGLPTRLLFEDRIAHEIARGQRKDHLVAVLSLNVDTIRRIDVTLGHRIAEQFIKTCGQRLNDTLRENIDTVTVFEDSQSMSTVSLLNETEFGILLTDIKQVDHITWVMKRLLDSFDKPFVVSGHEIYCSAYFGVSIFPHDGQTVAALYSSATNACSYIKSLGQSDRYMFASRNLNNNAAKQLKIENALHKAIDNDELRLHYQPKINSKTGQIAGLEALLRWQSELLGFVPPDKFIPVAEQSGQINRIGDWVIREACRQLRTWTDSGMTVVPIAINMSGIQLRQQNLASRIGQILDEFNIDVRLFEIELTESSLISSGANPYTILKKIKDMGIRVTMDDFGTGYSSLSYLRKIPLSCLKIDKSFVFDLHKDEHADKLIASIVSMAHELGLDVVAEGVEEKHQADYLSALGCEFLQGYYFSRPIPHERVEGMLQQQAMALVN